MLRLPDRLPGMKKGHTRRWDMASELVGDTGIEPVTSSVSNWSSARSVLRLWTYYLVKALVAVGLGECLRVRFARSSPRFLPMIRKSRVCDRYGVAYRACR